MIRSYLRDRERAADLLDRALDWTVVPGYSKVGYEVRKRLESPWSAPDLEGRSVVVTGATSGIGEAACVAIASAGGTVHLAVRDLGRGEEARERIAIASGAEEERLVLHVCDLSSLASVRTFASALANIGDPLHGLVNNAGVLPTERTETEEGFELTFATNVLGPFLLTAELLPALTRAADARVVSVSSGGMYTAKPNFDDLQLERQDFSGNRFYAHTKRLEVLLTHEWARRLPRPPGTVSFHSTHPGWVATPGVEASLPGFNKVMGPLLREPAAGADTIVWLLGAPEAGERSGAFWHDRRERPTDRVPRTRASATDERRLFDEVAALCAVDPAELDSAG
jgi:NAD(P)-dependent dehydrogenase (short-subunit alcohol dehydrogenase family)